MATLKNTNINDTGYFKLPVGTTAQRPGSPQAGYMRYNTTDSKYEIYDGNDWSSIDFINYSIVTNGLVLHLDAGDSASYPGSGTAWYDLSGNGNTLSLVNGPTYDSSNGGSIVFDGVNDYAWDTSTTYSSAGATSYSASIWINLDPSTSGVDRRFFWRGHYNILMYKSSDNTLRAYIRIGGPATANLALPPSSYSFDSWINMTCTFGGGIFKYYVNSVLIDSSNIGGSIINDASNRVELGAKASENYSYTNCKISSVLEYNRELSQAEITQNYNTLRGRYGL